MSHSPLMLRSRKNLGSLRTPVTVQKSHQILDRCQGDSKAGIFVMPSQIAGNSWTPLARECSCHVIASTATAETAVAPVAGWPRAASETVSSWQRAARLKTPMTLECSASSQMRTVWWLWVPLRTCTGKWRGLPRLSWPKRCALPSCQSLGAASSAIASVTCSVFEAELADHIPVVKTSIAGTRLVGRVTVGKLLSGWRALKCCSHPPLQETWHHAGNPACVVCREQERPPAPKHNNRSG